MPANTQKPDYESIAQALEQVSSELGPVEVDGRFCGRLCANDRVSAVACLRVIAPETQPGEAVQVLGDLFEQCRRQLNDPDCGFSPLLSGDESSTEDLVQELSEWCQGFLLGMAEGGMQNLEGLSEDAREFTGDLLEISRIESDYSINDTEEDAMAFEELLEYVRVGVLLIHEELNPLPASGSPGETRH